MRLEQGRARFLIDDLTKSFAEQRGHLRSVAYRVLGSAAEAEDALQETWLRLSRADTSSVQNLGGWLTTVTARVCLDMLRARKARREAELEQAPEPLAKDADADPTRDVVLADSVSLALFVVLETLDPVERVAFVLHDMFDLPFDEIARILGRSPAATRQMASRARRRVRGQSAHARDVQDANVARQRTIVEAFLHAARGGDLGTLVALLAPEVTLTADKAAVEAAKAAPGAPQIAERLQGREAVAATFVGRARAARPALLDGFAVAAVWAPGGKPRSVFVFTLDETSGAITAIDLMSDPEEIATLDVKLL
jgi:RNA polymerase sigma-70 factor (ECF subfamily)